MDVNVLIDAIVRQTTVLIAELATSRGLRSPLAHIADQVFLDLTRELDAQGVSRKVSADMFGMALRTYQRKVQRIRESATERGQTLWVAIHDFIQSREVVSRREILARFRHDEESVVRGVLTDLVESGFVFAAGTPANTSYRAASDAELGAIARERVPSDDLICALLFRTGPLTAAALAAFVRCDHAVIDDSLGRLVSRGRVVQIDQGSEAKFQARRLVVPVGDRAGWEAAVYDHYHAVVRTIVERLRRVSEGAMEDEATGGTTYSVELWDGHPMQDEVLGTLRRLRREFSALRERVYAHNRENPGPPERLWVVMYGGQHVWRLDGEDDEEK